MASTYRTKNSPFDLAVLEFKRQFLLSRLKELNFNLVKLSLETQLSRNTIYSILGMTKKELKEMFGDE